MDVSGIISKSLSEKPQDVRRYYIGASSIGNSCSRSIWYGYVGAESISPSPSLRSTFDIGKRLEGLLLDYMEHAGINIIRASKDNDDLFLSDEDVPIFQGHCDAILEMDDGENVILEIKTANTASFSRFKYKGLMQWNEVYYSQIQSYMGMRKLNRAVLLAIDKNTSELHHEWVDYDDIFYNELKMKALAISTIGEPPMRINKNPIFYKCNICSYRKICHA